jgi:hypothetical protein
VEHKGNARAGAKTLKKGARAPAFNQADGKR